MDTKIIKIIKKNGDEILKEASKIIRKGGLVVFPTETVYGLGANVFDKKALKKIFLAKGRPGDNPLIVHISKIDQLTDLVEFISQEQKKLIDKFWPGPLTIIFEKKKNVSNIVSGGLSTIAVRMPSNIFARKLIDLSGVPIAAPSANISGRPSGTRGKDIYKELSGKVEMIVDAGLSKIGVESTVIKTNKNKVLILRPGAVTKEMLEKVVSPFIVSFAKEKNDLESSPGTRYRHYAPKAELKILSKEKIKKELQVLKNNDKKVGIITTKENENFFKKYKSNIFVLGSEKNLKEISRNLYKALRFFDIYKVDVIFCQAFKKKGLGVAIMDRLEKASGKI